MRGRGFSKTFLHRHGVAGEACVQGRLRDVGPFRLCLEPSPNLHTNGCLPKTCSKLPQTCPDLTPCGWCEGSVKLPWRVFGITARRKPLCAKGWGIPCDGEGNFLNRLRARVRTRGLPRRLPPDASLPSARCSNASQRTLERLSTDACRRKSAHRFGENAHRFPKSAHRFCENAHRFPPSDGSFACI